MGDFCPKRWSKTHISMRFLWGFGGPRICLIIQEGTGAEIPKPIETRPIPNPTHSSMNRQKSPFLPYFRGFAQKCRFLPVFRCILLKTAL